MCPGQDLSPQKLVQELQEAGVEAAVSSVLPADFLVANGLQHLIRQGFLQRGSCQVPLLHCGHSAWVIFLPKLAHALQLLNFYESLASCQVAARGVVLRCTRRVCHSDACIAAACAGNAMHVSTQPKPSNTAQIPHP